MIAAIIAALGRGLRLLTGTQAGEALSPWLVGLYSFLGLTALALVFAWLTGTPLACVTSTTCDP